MNIEREFYINAKSYVVEMDIEYCGKDQAPFLRYFTIYGQEDEIGLNETYSKLENEIYRFVDSFEWSKEED